MFRRIIPFAVTFGLAAAVWAIIPPPCTRAQHRSDAAAQALAEQRVALRTAAVEAGWTGDERAMRSVLRRCDSDHASLERDERRLCDDPRLRDAFAAWEHDRHRVVDELVHAGAVCAQ